MNVAGRLMVFARPLARSLQSPPAYRRAMETVGTSSRKYLPLGAIPDDTDLDEVRQKWGSNAMDLINEDPIVYIDGDIAICDGGGGALGHPIEYIKLNVSDEDAGPQVCKYCGTRYMRRKLA